MSEVLTAEVGKKVRKTRGQSKFLLVSASLLDGEAIADASMVARSGSSIKELRKRALEPIADGEYLILCVRDRFEKQTTSTAVLKPVK